MKVKFKDRRDDYGAQETNIYMIASYLYRIDASPMRWRMFRLKLAAVKERYINDLNIDITDLEK